MAESERKSQMWDIRKSLLSLPPAELFQIALKVGSVSGKDPSELFSGDAETQPAEARVPSTDVTVPSNVGSGNGLPDDVRRMVTFGKRTHTTAAQATPTEHVPHYSTSPYCNPQPEATTCYPPECSFPYSVPFSSSLAHIIN
ncbi:hypothetical protein Q8A73_013491 [Channa argus]|nr:hypothetical protein Q8A73_013491 [Channa argus]